MERNINEELLKWKRYYINKPLFLYGARCVGKTTSILNFGKNNFNNIAYFNTLNNKELKNILDKEKNIDKLIMKLSILCGETIFKDDTLIIFDNIEDEKIVKLLKVFSESENHFCIVLISSNIIMVNRTLYEGFYYRKIFTMDFFEYLKNTKKENLIDFIKDSFDNDSKMPFHQLALDSYYEYLSTGGFPEVINKKIQGASNLEIESIKKKIIDIYKSEYAFYNKGSSIIRNDEIMNSVANILLKDNKKFLFGSIKKGSRRSEYEDSINYLVNDNILQRSYLITDINGSLNNSKDKDIFKLYYNDVGILYSKLFLNNTQLLTNENIRRSLIENDLANNLLRMGYSLYYYQSDSKAEVTFVIQNRTGKIIPIELTQTSSSKSKIMSVFTNKFGIEESIKITEDNFAKRKNVKLIPVYAFCCLKDL